MTAFQVSLEATFHLDVFNIAARDSIGWSHLLGVVMGIILLVVMLEMGRHLDDIKQNQERKAIESGRVLRK